MYPMKLTGPGGTNDFMSLQIQFKPSEKEKWEEKKQRKRHLHEGGTDPLLASRKGRQSDEQTTVERLKDGTASYRLSSETKAPTEFIKITKILRRTANHLTELLSSNQPEHLVFGTERS